MKGWVGLVGWPVADGLPTLVVTGHTSATGRAQDRESSPVRDRRSTTVPRHQLVIRILQQTYFIRLYFSSILEWYSHVHAARSDDDDADDEDDASDRRQRHLPNTHDTNFNLM